MKRHNKNSGMALPADARRGRRGQALVEIAMLVPFLFLLIVLVMNFSGLINAWISVANAARAAGDYAILSGSSAGLPTQATAATLQSLINADLATLPNISAGTNPQICVRQRNNATYTNIVGACSFAIPLDGDAINAGTSYINVAVDITYTYTPYFLGSRIFTFALPSLPTSVHQRVIMRIL